MNVNQAIGHIICNSDICAGCRTCEVVCSLSKEGLVNPDLSRFQVLKDDPGGYIFEAVSCLHCDEPECLLACPADAMYADSITGAILISEEKCTGCQQCMDACPAVPRRVRYNAGKSVCFKCDLCCGEPQCVKYCPTGAITYVRQA